MASDALLLIVPAASALGGTYLGARLQGRAAEDSEARALMLDAADALQALAPAMGTARLYFFTEGAHTSDEGVEAAKELQVLFQAAQRMRDRLRLRTPKGDPTPVHYENALLAIERGFEPIRKAAVWPNSEADRYPPDVEGLEQIEQSEHDYSRERTAFLNAAHDLLGPRASIGRTLKARLRRVEGR